MTALLDWVNSLDIGTLYVLLGAVAFVESIFPPAPADVVVAFGAFYAARRNTEFWPVVAAIVVGSVLGSLVVYAVARRFGADWMHARLRRLHLLNAEEKLEGLYAHYGLAALFVSRFVPGLRAVVSPMAGGASAVSASTARFSATTCAKTRDSSAASVRRFSPARLTRARTARLSTESATSISNNVKPAGPPCPLRSLCEHLPRRRGRKIFLSRIESHVSARVHLNAGLSTLPIERDSRGRRLSGGIERYARA